MRVRMLGVLAGVVIAMGSNATKAADLRAIEFRDRAPEGLVGNGRSVVRARPGGFDLVRGGSGEDRFRLYLNGQPHDLAQPGASATFFPGGVLYRLGVAGTEVEVLHGATPDVAYFVAIRVRRAVGQVEVEAAGTAVPALKPEGRVPVSLVNGEGSVVLATDRPVPPGSFDELRALLEVPYRTGLSLSTPSSGIDRSVPFHQYLLDLGFDGRLHVCEIFRWRDVWSRDLGSGLAPGAMAAGRFDAARTTIEYDLRRYASADPEGLKVTTDPSQGGSAEGTAWLARAVWRSYLLNGEKGSLAEAARTLRPWVKAWIDRDAAETGLLVDVTEWMDHSRFFLFPDGARVLYSNVLFADLLSTFAKIERELADEPAAVRLDEVRSRFVRGINAGLWNERSGEYDNLTLWGRRDERSSAAENALAVLAGVAPPERARRALAAVRERNWRSAGSVTIAPPMTHVPESNDHNHKMWPWWNAVEARARLRNGDVEGGIRLLEKCAATLEDESFPGLVEELTTPEGVSEGGHAFLTAAGSFLDAVVEGLLGIEVLEPGRGRIRVAPNVPASWTDWRATVPLPEGPLELETKGGRLAIRVSDPRVKVVEAPEGATVTGARKASLAPPAWAGPADLTAPVPLTAPPLVPRTAATFFEEGIPVASRAGLPRRTVSAEELLRLDPAEIGAVVVAGNALPRTTRSGGDVPAALARYLDQGGALVFFGATTQERGTMGETAGVVEWYEVRPVERLEPIRGWRLRASGDGPGVGRDDERGFVNGWQMPAFPDSGWKETRLPSWWENELGPSYDGWGWYRARFHLPAEWRGRTIALHLGRVDDDDRTFVNGVAVGATRGAGRVRRYELEPGDPPYEGLVFGGDNLVAVQVLDGGGTGGLGLDEPALGVATGDAAWRPIDPRDGAALSSPTRFGVVSWGEGPFFASWESRRGAFGFRVEGRGAELAGPLAGRPPLDVEVHEAFTDFAVARPWIFQPLAFTQTTRKLLVPDGGERYPCMARLANRRTGGEILLVPASLARAPGGERLLAELGIGAGSEPGAKPKAPPAGPGLARYREENVRLGPPRPGEGRVVFFGDSITEGWIASAPSFFAGRAYVGRGISGETTVQMLVRFRQDVLSLEPDVVVILAGTNDIAGNGGPMTLEATRDNLVSMVRLAREHGIRVVLASVLPAIDFPWRRGLEPAPKIAALNGMLAGFAAREGIVYLDYHRAMTDGNGGLRPGLSDDGVHPGPAGYAVMAPLAEAAVQEARRRAR